MSQQTGHVLWSEEYSGGDDLFDLSDRAAEEADAALQVEINARDAERLAATPDEELSPSELRSRAPSASTPPPSKAIAGRSNCWNARCVSPRTTP